MASASKTKGSKKNHGKPAMKKKSKLVVTFDPEKRKEYLTGFRKRKQERRRYGLDMEAYKQKKRQLEIRKERREEQKQLIASLNLPNESGDENANQDKEEEKNDLYDELGEDANPFDLKKAVTKVMEFDDEHTQNKFGDVVTVTTSVGDLKSDSEDEISELESYGKEDNEEHDNHTNTKKYSDNKQPQMTLFQRIQMKRKGLALPSKRAKLKEARASRKAMGVKMGKKGAKQGLMSKRKDTSGGGSAASAENGGGAKKSCFKSNNKRSKKKH